MIYQIKSVSVFFPMSPIVCQSEFRVKSYDQFSRDAPTWLTSPLSTPHHGEDANLVVHLSKFLSSNTVTQSKQRPSPRFVIFFYF